MTNEVNNVQNETTEITQYVDEFGNPIDPSLIDENGNYIGEVKTQYVDEFGNPIDPSLIDENGNYIGNQIQTETISAENIENSLNNVTNPTTIKETESAAIEQMKDKEFLTGMVTFDYNNVPITDIVNSIILDAINKGASDVHFDPFDDGIKIRIRIDGQLHDYSVVPLFVKKNMITRIKIISGMNITESRVPQDGAVRTELANRTIDLRVSCLPTNLGEKIVIRVMDYSMSSQGIEALDFNETNLEKVKKMLALPNGIILVTGATGTGKSTTVYSMLQRLNVEGTNLVTVEDPIEMNIGGINQVQTQSEIGLDFATVLRSILRQDPDVIMIGEIRDDETARIAVRASITGHLVLSTIHTNNSLNTIERLTDMSVERYLLGSSLSGIVSQKLARRLCPKCKKLRGTTDYEKDIFKKALKQDVNEIYEPVGCPECSRGYRGRIAIHEVLLVNQIVRDAITKGVDKSVLRNIVYQDCDTMLQDGLNKVLEGKTSFDEIIKLIDLDDDLGNGTQLGLQNQIEESNLNVINTTPNNSQININITPEMLSALNNINVKNDNNSEKIESEDKEIEIEEPIIEEEIIEPDEIIEIPKEEIENEIIPDDIIEVPTIDTSNEESINIDNETIPKTIISKEKQLEFQLNRLFDLKYSINKNKFQIKLKNTIDKIKDLIDNDYSFDNNTLKKANDLIAAIKKTNNNEAINLITNLFKIIQNDNDYINSINKTFDQLLEDINNIAIDSNYDIYSNYDLLLNDE